ncbi:hypothetical protein BGZ80_009301 [Entomortierella chlamydospora]|uniref:Major facilitator superfamily (MFS) profile domain-containing protein n=1 Tax=Entomortierella chlamydospora TaxID=101097 RepID=A0A9P6T0L4_9FUNG|nr:hypothetical protein BGZ79_001793 [Entomortierella chlamydospora]KAG0016319.1 hypothetical protein BGZ80_009301 [Entomortierella chlamydospora]
MLDQDAAMIEKQVELPIEEVVPASLVAPVIIHSTEETQEQDSENKDEKTHTVEKIDKTHDGHDDVDNEQPFGWVVVAAAFFVQALVIGTVNGYGVYQDRYEHHEYSTASTFQLSWVGTLNVVGMDLSGPLTGQFADHFGYRISAFTGALIMGASLLATSFSTQVWQLYIFQGIVYGLGASLAFFPSLSLPSQWFKRRRGFATGIAVAGGGVGGLVISPVTTALFGVIGYRWTVRVMAILHLVFIVPASILFKARVESGRDRAKRLKREQQDREKTNPTLAYAQNHGASLSTASLLIGVLNGASAIGRVSMGLASDHIGDINTLLISSLCACLSVLIVWILAGTSIPAMAVFCVIYGFFSGSFVAIVPTVAAHLCGIGRLASVTGIVYGGIALGTLIGSPVGGALLDLSDGVDYRPTQLWAGLVMAVGTVLTLTLKLMMNPKLFGRI